MKKTSKKRKNKFKERGGKQKVNIIEKYKMQNVNIMAEITFRGRTDISKKEMLELISKTDKLKHKGNKVEDLIITFGDMGILQRYNAPDLGVDYGVIPIYENKGLRIIIQYNNIINSFCRGIKNPFIRENFFVDNYEKLNECFSITFTKIWMEKIIKLFEEEAVKILRRTQKCEIQNENEAFELAQNLERVIKREIGEDFTEGLFELMKYDYVKQFEKLFFEYIRKNFNI